MKNNKCGQAPVLTEIEFSKIRKQIRSKNYKLLFDLAWYSGERWGALCKLRTEDCYEKDGSVRGYLTFRAATRKAAPDGKRKTRQVPIHPVLKEALGNYKPAADSQYLFPNREGDKPITLRWADEVLRSAVERAGLLAKGISTHSTRRTFITKLHRNGCDIYTIQKITGHQDLKALGHYIDIDADVVKGAIEAL
ncbi:MAG: tyrosine-type recombinase/integrase [Rivularia sp. (in: cyanobacteria)]